jgi:histone acetyltransferase (RNA polymerase elongator complex component)
MKPILIEIVTRVLTHFDHCPHCEVLFGQAGIDKKFHQKETEEYPADFKEEYLRLSNWIRELTHLYKHRVIIKLIDVQSLMGIYKSFRHRIRTYPTFIVEGKETYAGWDKNRLETLLDKHIKAVNQSKQQSLRPVLP